MKNRYKHILFDLDGTIYDSYHADVTSLYEIVKKYQPDSKETVLSLGRLFGIPGPKGLKLLNFKDEQIPSIMKEWKERILTKKESVKIFDGMLPVLELLQKRGCHLGIITSRPRASSGSETLIDGCRPLDIARFFDRVVSAEDVAHCKPAPDSILKYMQDTGASRDEILFIGDTKTDLMCAQSAGVHFGLALWGYAQPEHLSCTHYFATPWDILSCAGKSDLDDSLWFKWAQEIQAIGQIGLAYCKDPFDEERFSRLREIAAEIMHTYTEVPLAKIKESFCFDRGYITPKIDTRGVVFDDKGRIMLVQEKSGLWSIPGGWCEDNESIFSNIKKELREEACLEVVPYKLIALLDRRRYNNPPLPFGAIKAFVLCNYEEGDFIVNNETIDRKFFAKDELPLDKLRETTTSYEQLMMCFDAYANKNWQAVVD